MDNVLLFRNDLIKYIHAGAYSNNYNSSIFQSGPGPSIIIAQVVLTA